MRKCRSVNRILSLAVCLITLLLGGFVIATSSAAENRSDALLVGVPTDRCPMFYRDPESHELVGIGIDLMTEVMEEAGYPVHFVELTEPTLKDSLDNPGYDLILPFGSAISSTSGRSSVISEALFQTPFTLVTLKDKDLPSVYHIRVGMLKSQRGVADTVKGLYPDMEISFYDSVNVCVEALRSGKVEALLNNSYVWSYILQKPSYEDLEMHSTGIISVDFCAGTLDTPKGKALIAQVNKGIRALDDAKEQTVILDYTTRKLYDNDLFDTIYEHRLFFVISSIFFWLFIFMIIRRWQTMRADHEKTVRKLVDHDPLTGVLSMNGFRKRVKELLTEHPDISYAIAYNNINDFKFINDSLGKEAGDDLLRFWAERTRMVLTDEEAVGRAESDHFVVLRKVGGNIVASDEKLVIDPVRNYFIDQGKDLRVYLSTGIYVVMPEDYKDPDVDHMIDLARVVEKKVREKGKDGCEFYNQEQWEKEKWIADLVGHLRTAIRTNELRIWYQPQVDFETKEISGAEALCRWKHAKLGCIPPSEFIPALEDSGSIYELDCYVWDKVCQDLHRWNEKGKHMTVSVNVSRCDIHDNQNLADHFHGLIEKYDLTPDQLKIEITESAYVEDSSLLIKITQELNNYGFQVEMDDFGSGYSSLNMLKEVPVNRIKLDLRFLTEDGDPEKGRIIIECMIHMARALGMDIIAEGVETVEQAEFLNALGCTEMQGYYFFKPMPANEFEES
uniref:EAL domain-containing protein n=1 Tax=Eubacterium cellulosolvens (strain ATCC 43171 / JCM 9499 / 6) TaxID=633697 RepID=I5AXI4_EUBC6